MNSFIIQAQTFFPSSSNVESCKLEFIGIMKDCHVKKCAWKDFVDILLGDIQEDPDKDYNISIRKTLREIKERFPDEPFLVSDPYCEEDIPFSSAPEDPNDYIIYHPSGLEELQTYIEERLEIYFNTLHKKIE